MGRQSIVPVRWRKTGQVETIWDVPSEKTEKEHKSLARRGSNSSSNSSIDRGASYPPGTTNKEGYDANPGVMANPEKVRREEAEEKEEVSPAVTTAVSGVLSAPAMTKTPPLSHCDLNYQKRHRKEHLRECKESKAHKGSIDSRLEPLIVSVSADLDDPKSVLWNPPPRPECPICSAPLPTKPSESIYMACCGKTVCGGCMLKNFDTQNKVARRENAPLVETCAFCHVSCAPGMAEVLKQTKKRMEQMDSEAFLCMANYYLHGLGVPKDERKGFEHLLRAVYLGNLDAFRKLAEHSKHSKFVEADKGKFKVLLQLAAAGGNVRARHDLGVFEFENSHKDLALRHWRIAASAGLEKSLFYINEECKRGHVSKVEFAKTVRAFQAARKKMKSEERDTFSAAGVTALYQRSESKSSL